MVRADVVGRNLRNFVGDIHSLHHFTKYRVAKIALAMVEEGVIGHVDEELAGRAVWSAVRAMAIVPRVLRRPLSASF